MQNLGDRLHVEIIFCNQFIKAKKRPEIELEWMSSVAASFNYSLTLIYSFKKCIDDYSEYSIDDLGFIIGKIAIQHLIDIINSFERIMNKIICRPNRLSELAQTKINEKIELIELNWSSESNKKGKKLKEDAISLYKRKINEMAFLRDLLHNNDSIDDTDYDILKFAWDIRNSMHTNYLAIRDINFSYPDIRTGIEYYYNYKKGEELYHPGDLLGYLSISVQVEFIMLKILQIIGKEQ